MIGLCDMIRFPRMERHMTSFLPELNVRITLSVAGDSRSTQSWNCFPRGMRMARVRAAIAVSVLMTGFSVQAQQAAPPAAAALTTPPASRGIYVWPYNWAVKNGDFAKALAVPGVDGIGVHVEWSEISPALKTYDFTTIDRQLEAARLHHLAVELAVAAGQGTPKWLFTPPPLGLGLRASISRSRTTAARRRAMTFRCRRPGIPATKRRLQTCWRSCPATYMRRAMTATCRRSS